MNTLNKLINRATDVAKAAAMVFSRRASWFSSIGLGSTRFNFQGQVGDGRGSSIVMSIGLWLARAFPEAPIRVQLVNRDGDLETVRDHEMVKLIRRPNPYYSGILMWMATILDWVITGNAYWIKVRAGAGRVTDRVVQLWWVPSFLMEPAWPEDVRGQASEEFISHYDYTPGAKPIAVPTWNVVHFRYGIDPQNIRKGLSPLASLFREIFTDNEAANYTASILRNAGAPGLVVAPAEKDAEMPAGADLEEMKGEIRARFGGDNRGEPIVFRRPTQITQFGYSPEQMNLRNIRKIPEERVTAIFGIPAVVIGLGAGLDRSTFANYSEAREAAYESNVIPTQRLFAEDIRNQLLPDFADIEKQEVDFDISHVRVLQVDQNALFDRLKNATGGAFMKVNEARAAAGLDPLEGDNGEVLLVPISVVPTSADDLLPSDVPPEPQGGPPANGNPPGGSEDEDEDEDATEGTGTARRARADLKAPVNFQAGMTRIRARLIPAASTEIERFFDGERGRVIAALRRTAKVAVGDIFNSDAEEAALRRVLEKWYGRSLDQVAGLASDALGVSFDLDDATTRRYLRQSGTKIKAITTTTRRAVRAALTTGQANGESIDALAERLRFLPEFDRPRSILVARTELGEATNRATLVSYGASRVVAGVEVTDGLDFDDECAAINGKRFSLVEAASVPLLAHPNCTRAFSPITDVAELRSRNGHVEPVLIGT